MKSIQKHSIMHVFLICFVLGSFFQHRKDTHETLYERESAQAQRRARYTHTHTYTYTWHTYRTFSRLGITESPPKTVFTILS